MELACRVCLQVQELMVNIFETVDELQSNLSTLLEQCGGLKVDRNDPYPKYLCEECTSELLIAAKFLEKCTNTQRILQSELEIQRQTKEFNDHSITATDEFEAKPDDLEEIRNTPKVYSARSMLHGESLSSNRDENVYNSSKVNDSCSKRYNEDDFITQDFNECIVYDNTSTVQLEESEEQQNDISHKPGKISLLNQDLAVIARIQKQPTFDFECDICGASFVQAVNLRRHMEKTHPANLIFKCENCDFCGSDKSYVEKHSITCVTKVSTVEKFKTDSQISKKTQNSNTSSSYVCHFCSKQMQSQFALNMHLRTHTGDRPYGCTFCEKAFKTQSALNTHLKRHAGMPDYICNICGKTFYETSNLTIHMRTHTGDKPHKCKICGRSFTRVFLLQLHMRTHTKEKPYQCDRCERAFTQSCDLRNHLRTHDTVRLISCPHCPKTFNRSRAFRLHWRKYHFTDSPEPEDSVPCISLSSDALTMADSNREIYEDENFDFNAEVYISDLISS